MFDFIDFEASADDVDDSNNDFYYNDDEAVPVCSSSSNNNNDLQGFIDDDNLEDYYTFTNVNRSLEDPMQDSLLNDDDDITADLDDNESLAAAAEVKSYCHVNYDPNQDGIDEFTDSSRQVGEFKRILFCPQGVENPDSFYYTILYDLCFKKKNSKDASESDDQLGQCIENNKLHEALSKAKLDLKLDLDIQNFENQCYLVNLLLNENNLFL